MYTEIGNLFLLNGKSTLAKDDILNYLGLMDAKDNVVPDIDNDLTLLGDVPDNFYFGTSETDFEDLFMEILKEDTFKTSPLNTMNIGTRPYQMLTSQTLFNTTNQNIWSDDDVFVMRSPSFENESLSTQKIVSENESVQGAKNRLSSDEESTLTSRRKPNNCYHLWDFLHDILEGKIHTHKSCVEWANDDKTEFKITNTTVLSKTWGEKKQSKNPMTYDKLSRTIRYYCSLDILKRVAGKRLHFRFGNGRMWTKSFKKRRKTKSVN